MKTSIEAKIREDISTWLSRTPYPDFHSAIEERVTGQENLGRITAIVHNYLTCVSEERPMNCNTILAAPSGCGKTETYRALRDYFGREIPELPVYIYDASQITATGFKGSEPSDILAPFFRKGMEKAIGICFLDEIDKKLSPSYTSEGTNTNAEAQNNLLTIVEGGEVHDRLNHVVNTGNVMFVGLGSFSAFRDLREEDSGHLGFFAEAEKRKQAQEASHYSEITKKDMITAGGSYELIGRFPYVVNYHSLDRESILKVISLLSETVAAGFGCGLEIGDEMMDTLVESANSEFGCRLIESKIRESALDDYKKALYEDHEGKVLEIRLKSPEEATSYWREPTEEEIEEDRIASLIKYGDGMDADVFDDLWDATW